MTPLEFLAVVLPSPGTGYYCAVELTKKKEHAFVEKLEDLLPYVDRWNKANCDVFFGLSTFQKAGRRTAENTVKIKAFFIDMDGYESKKAAALALDAFMEKVGLSELGKPWIVSSGGGLHCYWPLTEELPTDVWKPVADNLKRLCAQEKMSIDMSVTSDSARGAATLLVTNIAIAF